MEKQNVKIGLHMRNKIPKKGLYMENEKRARGRPKKEVTKQLKTKYMLNNEEYLELFSDYENYRLCQEKGLIENMSYLTFSEFLKKRALIEIRLKEEFDRKRLSEFLKKHALILKKY